LSQISDLIDWVPIRRRLDEMYNNKSEKGGRPNCDVFERQMDAMGLQVKRRTIQNAAFIEADHGSSKKTAR
jgi:hypothetical protein